MEKKYFFFDIDGTLAYWENGTTPVVSDKVKETIQRLKQNGHFVALATGRSFAMAQDYLEMFDIDHMVCDGGNGFCLNKELIKLEPLNKEACIALAKECVEKHIPFAFSPDNSEYRIAYDTSFDEFTNDDYMKTIVDTRDVSEYEQIYKMYVAGRRGMEESVEALKALPWIRYGETYIFVEPLDKSVGIKMMMDYLQADYKDVVVFGDQKNDLSMFRKEWTSIAMGNAIEELKEKANYVTDSVDHDGVYTACVRFNWI